MASDNQNKELKLYDVKIAGLHMKLKSPQDQATLDKLVALVNTRIDEALESGAHISFQNALIIASLNMAEELITVKKSAHHELDSLEKKAKKILTGLESTAVTQMST